MFRRTFAALRAAAAFLGLMSASPGPSIARAKVSEYPTPRLDNYQGSGGHRRGRHGFRPLGGIPGAGLWRKARKGKRVRGW